MKKKVILLLLILVISAFFFIPVNREKTTLIKSSFLNIYGLLANPLYWEKWRPELRNAIKTDSDKILVTKDSTSFRIKYTNLSLGVKFGGTTFEIKDTTARKNTNYSYTLIPVNDKFQNKTDIVVVENTNVLNYLCGMIWPPSFSGTHIDDFKNFMETDSLRYGFKIFKTGVPESNLIVIRREVLKANKFTEAAKMLATLKQHIKANNIKQIYPVIAQFLPKGKDSSQVNVGFFIDKEVASNNEIIFTRMPKGGPLFAAKFKGEFSKRGKAYVALNQYFIDYTHQTAILPFETYLDNKLPHSDNDIINIQVNFSTYPSDSVK